MTYNHGGKYILSGSSDRTIRLWNPTLGKEIKAYKGHAHEILALDMYVPLSRPLTIARMTMRALRAAEVTRSCSCGTS